MRMSVDRAVSMPPPMQYPSIMARIGLSTVDHARPAAADASS
jgi:hypothetical protein